MTLTLYILLVISALLVFAEDCRTRLVTVWKIALVLLAALLLCLFSECEAGELIVTVASNLAFLLFIYFGLLLFYYIKEGRLDPALRNKVGLADGLLLLAPALSFSVLFFLCFVLLAVLSGCLYAAVLYTSRKKNARPLTVPLAGILSLLLGLVVVVMDVKGISRYNELALLEKLFLP